MDAHARLVPTVESLLKAMEESEDSLQLGSARVRMGAVGTWLRDGFDIERQQYVVRYRLLPTTYNYFTERVFLSSVARINQRPKRRQTFKRSWSPGFPVNLNLWGLPMNTSTTTMLQTSAPCPSDYPLTFPSLKYASWAFSRCYSEKSIYAMVSYVRSSSSAVPQ